MVEFVNPITKTAMWVADDRVEEYKAAGYSLAAKDTPKTEEKPTVKVATKEIIKKSTSKKK